jgi:hypothetical protein
MSSRVNYSYGSYNFTAQGQNYNLMDLAVGGQSLPLLDRAKLFTKTRLGLATEQEGDTRSLYDAVLKIQEAASEIFVISKALRSQKPDMATVENMVSTSSIFKDARKKIEQGLNELEGLELTVEKSSFGKIDSEAFIRGIAQVAYAQLARG